MNARESILMSCSASEKALVLTALLDQDPTLREHAEDFARRLLVSVDITAISDLIVETILKLGTDDLANRAGPRRHGYVEPTDAAWQLLEEAIEPWIDDLRRRGHLGLNQAAADVATALTNALEVAKERADRVDDCLLRQWAPDFPSEAATLVERELGTATGSWARPTSPSDPSR